MKRKPQQGVALVITLILLSVITFMAVTFLVVSRHEAAGVSTLNQQTSAKNAADAALAQGIGTLTARVITTTNGLYSVLTVSTNYVQPSFIAGNVALTNVSYYDATGNLLQGTPMQQMQANLQILPRAPVFVTSNKNQLTPPDFRFYLDLNRNGVYDPNGAVYEHDPNGISGSFITNFYVGDPEWVGILNHPDQRHSSSNQFIGRYCYIILPVGNSLDINYANNQNKVLQSGGPPVTQDGFIRNQGVGSWEINVAAFLSALNPNTWWYNYLPTNTSGQILAASSGGSPPGTLSDAFRDASGILQYRYSTSYLKLTSFGNLFGVPAANTFGNEFIDGYGAGPLMLGFNGLTADNDAVFAKTTSWSGDDTPNPFFTTQDLFIPNTFSNSLFRAGRNYTINSLPGNAGIPANPGNYSSTNSYNRYTFYRLLSQMGVASAPEPSPYPTSRKINLNYANVNGASATSFQGWTPLQFFTNTANALLAQAGYNFNVANIPIYPTNFYTPSVHRLLQLAANIYDASTNKGMSATGNFGAATQSGFDYPSVFRPLFRHTGTNVFISGYTEDLPTSLSGGRPSFTGNDYALPDDLTSFLATPSPTPANANVSVYGIPWVIGVRKGLPNFNEFSMQSIAQVTRKLQVVYGSQTNIQYTIGVSNQVGIEAWNSYLSNYTRAIDIIGLNSTTMSLSNDVVGVVVAPISNNYAWSYAINSWPGRPPNMVSNPRGTAQSFQMPLSTNFVFLTDSVYHPNTLPHFSSGTNFDTGVLSPLKIAPHFILSCTNRMRFVLVDHATQRVLDYVHFDLNGTNFARDLTAELQGTDNGGNGGVWQTNIYNNIVMQGVENQLQISEGLNPNGFNGNGWVTDSLQGNSKSNEITQFRMLMAGGLPAGTTMQAPYTPTRKTGVYYTWQANDPLVHYTLGDLTPMPPLQTNVQVNYNLSLTGTTNLPNIGRVNQRYLPWNNTGNTLGLNADKTNAANLAVKDPQITQSDDWQFPTNKFPNIGWLGRVHRGTPWQTVYLKSTAVDITNWQTWTGNTSLTIVSNIVVADAGVTTPTNDWKILDLFTTAPNDNASRGQLSINAMSVDDGGQTNLAGLAAWSAILDGVFVLSNSAGTTVPICIDPTNVCTVPGTGVLTNTVQYLVSRINAVRSTNVSGVFTNLGQILSVPELTVASPYINTNSPSASLNDAVYERIPQQIMSLLRVGTPRYAIFAYGQSLQPAPHSIVQSGTFLGMCTNYQITGEVATRTIVRIEGAPVPVPIGQVSTNTAPRAVVESFNVLAPGD